MSFFVPIADFDAELPKTNMTDKVYGDTFSPKVLLSLQQTKGKRSHICLFWSYAFLKINLELEHVLISRVKTQSW